MKRGVLHRPRVLLEGDGTERSIPRDVDVESVVKGSTRLFRVLGDRKEEDQMFSKATRSQILLEAMPDALGRGDQKRMIMLVNHQTERLFANDRDDVDISSPRIDTGDFLLHHGGA